MERCCQNLLLPRLYYGERHRTAWTNISTAMVELERFNCLAGIAELPNYNSALERRYLIENLWNISRLHHKNCICQVSTWQRVCMMGSYDGRDENTWGRLAARCYFME